MDDSDVLARLEALAREATTLRGATPTTPAVEGEAGARDAREIANLRIALRNRTVIGQATGVLAERYSLDMDRAFEVLKRLSRDLGRKVADIAEEVVATGRLPERPAC